MNVCEKMKSIHMNELADLVVSKREDPNYSQLSGYIPRDIARQFKIACTSKELSHSDALEEAVLMWLQSSTDQYKHSKGGKPGEVD